MNSPALQHQRRGTRARSGDGLAEALASVGAGVVARLSDAVVWDRVAPEESTPLVVLVPESALAADVRNHVGRHVIVGNDVVVRLESTDDLLPPVLVVILREDARHPSVHRDALEGPEQRDDTQHHGKDDTTPPPPEQALRRRAHATCVLIWPSRLRRVGLSLSAAHVAATAKVVFEEAHRKQQSSQQEPHEHDAQAHEEAEFSQGLEHGGEVGEE
mmetsp:Transcript_61326/g.175938  ORF Transcript_61326/g.175938 Transcript_61326/m.175938 type:complete len:216 (+) Transcript_61326:2363-3010(+)